MKILQKRDSSRTTGFLQWYNNTNMCWIQSRTEAVIFHMEKFPRWG